MVPPPAVTAKATAVPSTGAPDAVATLTLGRLESGEPAVPVKESDDVAVSVLGDVDMGPVTPELSVAAPHPICQAANRTSVSMDHRRASAECFCVESMGSITARDTECGGSFQPSVSRGAPCREFPRADE